MNRRLIPLLLMAVLQACSSATDKLCEPVASLSAAQRGELDAQVMGYEYRSGCVTETASDLWQQRCEQCGDANTRCDRPSERGEWYGDFSYSQWLSIYRSCRAAP